jgi:nitrite reductase (NADH) small subunit
MGDAASAPAAVKLGPLDGIAPGQGFCFLVAGKEVAVFRQRDGALFAVQNRCPHRNAPLAEGVAGGGRVICPFHGHSFDLRTGKGPSPDCALETWPVRVERGEILLTLEPRRAP